MIEPTKALAIFDLDNTLIDGDCEVLWSRFLFEKGVVDKSFLMRIKDYYLAYDNGHLDIHKYEAFLLYPLTIHPMPKLIEWRSEYLQQVQQAIWPKLMRRVKHFRALGFTLLLITASNNFIAEPIAKLLHFPHLICTQIKQYNGQYTTQIEGIPAFQDGKVRRLELWLAEREMTLEGSWGYSDSHNDLPLLQQVSYPVAVRPDAILRNHAIQAGWEILK